MNEKIYVNCSNAILYNLLEVPEFQHAQKVFIFISKYPEPFTRDIIAFCFMAKKEVYVPIIRNGEMLLAKYNPTDELVVATYGIKEPLNACPVEVMPDIAIVPMVAYDDNKNRLGHGKGYYDKYFANNDVYKIGICFSRYGIPNIDCDEHDVPMDMIITEEGYLL
ncbi:MAG: 5-formyltetrahydrofolate cyclo-ligase [Clostridia bacterium]|nr:5-formyltetrahydrofolate cyclo-ligase [Clostridia bacterium]